MHVVLPLLCAAGLVGGCVHNRPAELPDWVLEGHDEEPKRKARPPSYPKRPPSPSTTAAPDPESEPVAARN